MIVTALILGIVPTIVWLGIYLQEDLHPEPKSLLAWTFMLGIASASAAVAMEAYAMKHLAIFGIIPYSMALLFVFAVIEETVKFGAAYLAVHKHPAFNEPVDAMIYAIVAALGFATVENIGAVGGVLKEAGGLLDVARLMALRSVGATLLHTLAAGIMGYFWALSIRESGDRQILLVGICMAIGLHLVFNLFILNITLESLLSPTMVLLVAAFFVFHDFEKLKRKTP